MNPQISEKPNTSPARAKRSCRTPWWKPFQTIIGASSRPILIGPWRGELGFEALYWLPFLAALRDRLKLDPARLHVISRGGMGALYQAPRGAELFALRTPQDVRVENRIQYTRTGQMKQTHRTDFDRAVLKDAAAALGLSKYHVLDPGWMFQTLYPFWTNQRGLAWVHDHLRFEAMPVPDLPAGVEIAPNTVAVRFYFRATYPASEQTISFAIESIKQLASQQPVLILDSGLHLDDHADPKIPDTPNVRRLSKLTTLTPENNLAIQAAALARCCGFVGTYGGTAQLALRYGKPSISYYTDWHGTALAHRQLSDALSLQQGVPFICLKLGDGPLLQSVMPRFLVK